VARAVAKQRRKKAQKAAANRPKAPRTEAQINAARANMEKARAAREANQANQQNAAAQSAAGAFVVHPADAAGQRPTAFFTLGGKGKSRAEKKAESKAENEQARQAQNDGKEPPHVLTAYEAENFRERLFGILVSLWELADKGLSATALDGAECDIWRSIDDEDTSFLVDRIIAKGRQNAFIGAQVRMLIDHWSDARMVAILGPRVLESAGWHQAHGLNVAFAGINVQAPPKARRSRKTAQNGHQAGTTGYGPTQPYQPSGSEGAMYGAQ
jgi:hypothetical protein